MIPHLGMSMTMADSGAVMGLIGAIGGALVGGVAGAWGQLLLKRRERRDLEADRAAERRELEEDRIAERRALQMHRSRELAHEKILNLSIARVKTRLWYDFLVQTVNRASAEEPVDAQTFLTDLNPLAGGAMEACYGLARLQMARGGDPNGVLRELRNAQEVIYTALKSNEFANAPMSPAVKDALEAAASARSWFRLTIDRLVEERYRSD